MKKTIALLLILALSLTLIACGEKKTNSENQPTNTATSQTQTSETITSSEQSIATVTSSESSSKTEKVSSKTSSKKKDTSSKTSSKKKTSSTTKPAAPTKLNPKTDFKFGKYTAKTLSSDKKSYCICSLIFYEDFDGLEYQKIEYFTKEEIERLYSDFGFDYNDPDTYNSKVTVNGVIYYNLIGAEILPEAYKMTDKDIKITPDYEKWGTLSLNANGTLVLDKAENDRYGKVGTIFTFIQD